MSDQAAVALALLAAIITSIVAPVVLVTVNWFVTRQAKYQDAAIKRRTREEDWARQDAVAAKAEAATAASQRTQEALVEATRAQEERARVVSEQLLAAQAESIARTDEVARIAATNQASTDLVLQQIHILVNSDYTEARRAVLEQAKTSLVLLRKVVLMDRDAGRPPTSDDENAVAAVERFIAGLEAELEQRAKAAQDVVDVEHAKALTAAVTDTALAAITPPHGTPTVTAGTVPADQLEKPSPGS